MYLEDIQRKEKIEIIGETFKDFNKENDFYFKTPRIILKDNYDIIHYLIIAPRLLRIVCDVVAQPMYIPATSWNLDIGVRLQFTGENERFPWGHCYGSSENYQKDLDEIKQLFETGGLEWLSNFSTPERIIKSADGWSIEKYKFPWPPGRRLEIKAISELYIGDIEKGIYTLRKALASDELITQRSIDEFNNWLNLAQNESEKLPAVFDDIISTTRKNLKLNDKKCNLLKKLND